MQPTIRQYQKGDEQQITNLLTTTLHWPRLNTQTTPQDHYAWKHLHPPNPSTIIVAEHQGTIIGCAHVSVTTCKAAEDTIPLGNGVDVAVRPDHRRHGLFNAMTQKRIEAMHQRGIPLALWSSGNPILVDKYNHTTQRFPQDIHGHARIRDIGQHLQNMKDKHPTTTKAGYTTLSLANALSRKLGPKTKDTGITVQPIKKFDQQADQLYQTASQQFTFITERKKDYLNWRYLDRRAGEYTVLAARDQDQLLGYAALATNKTPEGYTIGYIADLLTQPSRPDAADALLNEATETFDKQDINTVITLSTPTSPYNRSLYRAGFIDSQTRYNLWYSHFTEAANLHKKTRGATHFQFGDRDTLPIQIER